MPITQLANVCQGYAIAISLKPQSIDGLVLAINKVDQIILEPDGAFEPEPSCQNCQWCFAELQHKKKIEIIDQEGTYDKLKILGLNVSALRKLV